MPTLTIIETGLPPEKIRGDWPAYPEMFRDLLEPYLNGWAFESVALSSGEALPDPKDLDAILITGSAAGVYDDFSWMAPLMAFIRDAATAQTPQIGANALGADVAKSDKGWGIGRHVYDIEAPQAWMGTEPPTQFSLGVSHQDQVLSLPPDAIRVATNDFCEFAALAYPDAKAISFQGHPEFSSGFSCALYGVRKGTRLPVPMVEAAEASFSEPIDNDQTGQWMARLLLSEVD